MKHVVKRDGQVEPLSIEKIRKVVQSACEGYICDPNELEMDAQIQFKPQMPTREIQSMLIKTAIEKVTVDTPDWQFVAAKLLLMDIYKECALTRGIEGQPYQNFHDFIVFATSIGIYSPKILQAYSEEQIKELQDYIKPERDFLFNYAGLKTFSDRYMIRTHTKDYLELPQEAFMGVAMFIALAEEASKRIHWAKQFYDVLSKFEVMTATPTLSNARKVHHQLSSCFILSVDDSLDSIFDNVNTFAQLSKHGGGVGGDMSMIRAQGSEIRGYQNVAGGVIPWIRILNDSAIAVDQLGCVHKDSYVRVLKYVKTDKFTHNFFNRHEYGFSLDNEEVAQIIREHALKFSFSHSKWSKSDIEDFITMYVQGLPLDTVKNHFGMSRDQYKKIATKFKKINKGLPQGFVLLTGDLEDYAIHSSGEIIHKDSFKTLAKHRDRKGYVKSTLAKRSYALHRLLATTFMDVPEGYTIDHIDGDKTNNSLDNLQVISSEENISKGWEDSRLKRTEMARIRRHLSYGHELNGARRDTHKIKIQSVVVEPLPISKVCVGDTVESFNIETGKVEYKKVQATHSMTVEVEDQIKLSFSDGGFITTSNWHPFPVKRNNKIMYVRSDEVTLGDVTFNHKGIPTQVVDIDQEPNVSNSYKDLTIQDNNNYFCSSSSKEDNFHVIHNTRKGALSLTLNVYHSDIMDFLDLKTNNGDERRKAHDIFPSVGLPDNFMKAVEDKGDYYLFDPYMVRKYYNQEISDLYGEDFEELYDKIVLDDRIEKKKFKARTIFKKLLKSSYETGLPFVFFRDTVNRLNPNKHEGIVRSSNLCMEIIQNMSPTKITKTELEDGKITIEKEAGDLVVCNLSSLNLYRVHEEEDLKRVIPVQVRMLDNVITLNFYPVREAEHTNQRYRAIGLGTMGYHAYLANKGIAWESEAHIEEADELYEKISYHTIKASSDLAKEKGSYPLYEGSDWQKGDFFGGRDLGSRMDWDSLKKKVNQDGLRNGYLLAVAPTGSISIISGTTASIDPIFAKVEKTEKKDGILISAVPGLNDFTRFMYKESHKIDMNWSVRANAARQKWIDQSQSFNLFISQDTTAKELFSYYFNAWKEGCKTVYYLRSKAVEVEECESCT